MSTFSRCCSCKQSWTSRRRDAVAMPITDSPNHVLRSLLPAAGSRPLPHTLNSLAVMFERFGADEISPRSQITCNACNHVHDVKECRPCFCRSHVCRSISLCSGLKSWILTVACGTVWQSFSGLPFVRRVGRRRSRKFGNQSSCGPGWVWHDVTPKLSR